jgi:hypothetical protein
MISCYCCLKFILNRRAEKRSAFRRKIFVAHPDKICVHPIVRRITLRSSALQTPIKDIRFQSYYDDFRTRKYHSHNSLTCFAV